MFLQRRIDNRHILWSALLMGVLGFVLPGALGVKPPQWFPVLQQAELIENISQPGLPLQTDTIPVETVVKAPELLEKPVETSPPTPDVPEPPVIIGKVEAPSSNLDLPLVSKELIVPQNNEIIIVAANFVRQIPEMHLELSGVAQKQSFVDLILPLILQSNHELSRRRSAIEALASAENRVMLEKWAVLYRVDPKNLDDSQLIEQLLHRVDAIPVALAMAQAAVESGWGTSRFALQGNALFGQWAWTESAGMRPLDASNERAVVRSFGSLLESVRAYMHNLNTHPSYRRFRDARQRLKQNNEPMNASKLAAFLDSYAEIGMAYVDKILAIISSNNFDKYARARLG